MMEYFSDEEGTKKAIRQNGWLYTGDLGTIDEEGYLPDSPIEGDNQSAQETYQP